MFKFYEVGGKVRDELLGLVNKDVDYVAVADDEMLKLYPEASNMFKVLEDYLRDEKFEIFLVTPECYTIRAMFPKNHKYTGVADFVMARKEIGYIPNTRTPIVKPGTLYDDLLRRDLTINAMAKDDNGNIIDYFNGMLDLKRGILRTPQSCDITFNEDPLRILRVLRFSITKNMSMVNDIYYTIWNYEYNKMSVVSTERIKDELTKCFSFDVIKTLEILNRFPKLTEYIFKERNIWLKPTSEKNKK